MLLRLFIIELEKLCSSCFLVEKYAKKRLECLGNVGWQKIKYYPHKKTGCPQMLVGQPVIYIPADIS